MNINLRDAKAMTILEGRGYYFCSKDCQEQFLAEPDRYSKNAQAECLTVGVMGSAGSDEAETVPQRARLLGYAAALKKYKPGQDVRRWMQTVYAPRLWKRAWYYTIASRRYQPLLQVHEDCDCTWCRCERHRQLADAGSAA
jgi:YHS domain-containing protein